MCTIQGCTSGKIKGCSPLKLIFGYILIFVRPPPPYKRGRGCKISSNRAKTYDIYKKNQQTSNLWVLPPIQFFTSTKIKIKLGRPWHHFYYSLIRCSKPPVSKLVQPRILSCEILLIFTKGKYQIFVHSAQ